jgi:hypothetical protein
MLNHIKAYRNELAVASLAAVLVLLLSHYAPGYTPDTPAYIAYAKSGDVRDLPYHYGVLYAWVLGITSRSGLDIDQCIMVVNMVAMVVLAVGTFRFLRTHLQTGWLAMLAVFWLIVSLPFLTSFSFAMSEGVFMAFLSFGLFAMVHYYRGDQMQHLITGGIALGMATLTRYAGLSFVAVCMLLIALFPKDLFIRKTGHFILFATCSLGPLLVISLWNHLRVGSATNRQLDFRWPSMATINEGLVTISSWFVPYRLLVNMELLPWLLTIAVLLTLFFLLMAGIKRRYIELILFVGCAIAYLVFLFTAIMFADASIMLNHRMLTPFLFCIFLGVMLMVRYWPKNVMGLVVVRSLLLYLLMFGAYRAEAFVVEAYQNGQGLNSRQWRESTVVQQLDALSRQGVPIYSNAASAMDLIGISGVQPVPPMRSPTSGQDLTGAEAAYREMIHALGKGAILGEVKLRYWPWYLPGLNDIVRDASLVVVGEYADGRIYSARGDREKTRN